MIHQYSRIPRLQKEALSSPDHQFICQKREPDVPPQTFECTITPSQPSMRRFLAKRTQRGARAAQGMTE
jgi:hypothetical protein